jgi:hypothetical protein
MVELGQPYWCEIARQIEKGEYPTGPALAKALRGWPTVPPDLVDYVAGRLNGTIARDRRPYPGRERRHAARWLPVAVRVRIRQARYRALRFRSNPSPRNLPDLRRTLDGWKVKGPKERAIRKVAARRGITPAHLEKEMRRLMASPHGMFVPTLEDIQVYLEGSSTE